MASIQYDVAEAFRNGKVARSGSFFSTGLELYSYTIRLAHKDADGDIILDFDPANRNAPSSTTNRHMIAASILAR